MPRAQRAKLVHEGYDGTVSNLKRSRRSSNHGAPDTPSTYGQQTSPVESPVAPYSARTDYSLTEMSPSVSDT